MHIVCPHCTTSYAIDLATLGAAGRTVRCSRCKEVWLAKPEDAHELAAAAPVAEADEPGGHAEDTSAEWAAHAHEDEVDEGEHSEYDAPIVDSPSISSDFVAGGDHIASPDLAWAAMAAEQQHPEAGPAKRASRLRRSLTSFPGKSFINLPTACTAMGALVLALMIWRVDVVRLMPQTAAFYKMVGLDVNLRGLAFKDVKITTETVEGKPVLVIQGVIVGESRKPVELPRLRFSVRDAQGAEIYAWNSVLEQPVLNPGEKAWFKSRLASPPPEGRNIDVRFFSKRDIAGA